ncbi:MAG: hypothetical protein ACTS1Z_13205 [Parasphingopyxis sp.]|uniref:hypothetical protein n=1 Tax=Parasphingopyxis sp. TaxID=1920299 RepID=UPI003FA16D0F
MKKSSACIAAVAAIFCLSASPASAQNNNAATELRGPQNNQQVGLLLPAVQSAREAARRPQARGAGGGPHVRVFDGQSSNRARNRFDRGTQTRSHRGGVRVAVGDVNGDGYD